MCQKLRNFFKKKFREPGAEKDKDVYKAASEGFFESEEGKNNIRENKEAELSHLKQALNLS